MSVDVFLYILFYFILHTYPCVHGRNQVYPQQLSGIPIVHYVLSWRAYLTILCFTLSTTRCSMLPEHDHLPPYTNSPTTELGYRLSIAAIDLLFKHELICVAKRPHASSDGLRLMIERICKGTYVSKGDVYCALVEKGVKLTPMSGSAGMHYVRDYCVRITRGVWDRYSNHSPVSRAVHTRCLAFDAEWSTIQQSIINQYQPT